MRFCRATWVVTQLAGHTQQRKDEMMILESAAKLGVWYAGKETMVVCGKGLSQLYLTSLCYLLAILTLPS
jgi:hypothetical protein